MMYMSDTVKFIVVTIYNGNTCLYFYVLLTFKVCI